VSKESGGGGVEQRVQEAVGRKGLEAVAQPRSIKSQKCPKIARADLAISVYFHNISKNKRKESTIASPAISKPVGRAMSILPTLLILNRIT
jgi:hypothetical protein